MSVYFVNNGDNAELRGDTFSISVLNDYCGAYEGETYKMQCDKINRLLSGERELLSGKSNLYVSFEGRDGESRFTIDSSGTFRLTGGSEGPPFGGRVSIFCDYESNKEELDKFMRYMLRCFDNDSEDNDD